MSSNGHCQDQEDEAQDQFSRLPEALLHEIINRLQDAKSLCLCSLVCKRFSSVIPQVHNVSLNIPTRNTSATINSNHNNFKKGLFKNLVNKLIVRPLSFLIRVIKPKSSLFSSKDYDDGDDCYCYKYSPAELLKNFDEVRFLRIQLPDGGGGQMGSTGNEFLKWKAEFGSRFRSCVVMGSTSLQRSDQVETNEQDEEKDMNGCPLAEEDLKLRVVWTLSSLIAASSTHQLVQQVVSKHPMLEALAITDAFKQGSLCMKKEEIKELRKHMEDSLNESETRSRLPALKMKLWHVPELELPGSGYLMKGATMVMVRPVDGFDREVKISKANDDFMVGGFDRDDYEEEKIFDEAVRKMMKKKKVYTLETNSF